MRSSSLFAVQEAIVPLTAHVKESELRAALAPASGENLFRLSCTDLEERLEQLPYVKRAEVHRRFPSSLEVTVEEHVAAARVQLDGGRIWLLSEDGRVLEVDRGQAPERLVIVPPTELRLKVGDRLPSNLLGALQLASDLTSQEQSPLIIPAQTVSLTSAGQATVFLQGGTQVRLGELAQLEEKLMVARQLIEEYSRDERVLAYVDVYLPDRPVAKVKAP
jgi:cell division septal protein FtsQ